MSASELRGVITTVTLGVFADRLHLHIVGQLDHDGRLGVVLNWDLGSDAPHTHLHAFLTRLLGRATEGDQGYDVARLLEGCRFICPATASSSLDDFSLEDLL